MESRHWRRGTLGASTAGTGVFIALATGYLLRDVNLTGAGLAPSMFAFGLVGLGVALGTKKWPEAGRRRVTDPKRRSLVGAAAVATLGTTLAGAMVLAGVTPAASLAVAVPAILLAAAVAGPRLTAAQPAAPRPALLAVPCILLAAAILYAPLLLEYGDNIVTGGPSDGRAWQEGRPGIDEGRLAPPVGNWTSGSHATSGATHLNVTATWASDPLDAASPAEVSLVVHGPGEAWYTLGSLANGARSSFAFPEDAVEWRIAAQGVQSAERTVRVSWHLAWSPHGST